MSAVGSRRFVGMMFPANGAHVLVLPTTVHFAGSLMVMPGSSSEKSPALIAAEGRLYRF